MPKHAVVDGSNIATESRAEPSLQQLREAVATFTSEHAFDIVTVIVDASFEHRVAKAEQNAVRAAIDANEIITPPAGVIGRGDTFILQVADRAQAVVLSNDSFQEFHGTFGWLFDEGRLIGGKPIPGVGWIFVPRAPVRGPVSRRARATAENTEPKQTKPKQTEPKTNADKKPTKRVAKKVAKKVAKTSNARVPTTSEPVGPGSNPRAAWNAFRRRHPEGSMVNATVDEFSSHGAYATSGAMTLYLPLRLLGDPAPQRARDAVTLGQSFRVVIHRYDHERLGIDAGLIALDGSGRRAATKKAAPGKKAAAKKAAPTKAAKTAATKPATGKKAAAKKAAAKTAATKPATGKKAAAKRAAPNKAAKKAAPGKKATAKKAAPTKKAAATRGRATRRR